MHTAPSPSNHPSPAYLSSVLLHVLVVALIVAIGLFVAPSKPETPQVFEVVAGAGDNYMATQATALGSEHGIKLDLPPPPTPMAEPTPPAPAEAVTTPTPAPVVEQHTVQTPVKTLPIKPVSKPATKTGKTSYSSFEKTLTHALIVGENKVKMHELAEKRKEEARQRALAKSQHLSYQQFLKNQQSAENGAALGKSTGVVHGKSLEAGAGGSALTAQQRSEMAGWTAYLLSQWKENFIPPPDFNEKMTVHVAFYVSAAGEVSRIRLSHSTGNPAFDEAVKEALERVHLPPPPSHRGDDYDIEFSLTSDDSG